MRPTVWNCDNTEPHGEHQHVGPESYMYICRGVPASVSERARPKWWRGTVFDPDLTPPAKLARPNSACTHFGALSPETCACAERARPDSRLEHACTVNGEDAQYWFSEAERWKKRAGEENLTGRTQERRLWQKATGCEFASWFPNNERPSHG